MRLSKVRLQQIIKEEVTRSRKLNNLNELDLQSQKIAKLEAIGDLISWAIANAENPEVVERLERADQLITELFEAMHVSI